MTKFTLKEDLKYYYMKLLYSLNNSLDFKTVLLEKIESSNFVTLPCHFFNKNHIFSC